MDERIAGAVAAAAVAALPLLAGCGTGSAADGSSVAPSSVAPSTVAPSTVAPSTAAPSADAVASTTPSPSLDPARQTKQVQAATETFVRTVLTIGYPDKTFDDYTDRIEPLMTKAGFDSFENADSIKKGSTALTSLYPQRARSAPRFADDPEVTSIDATSASAQLAYENVAQRRSGSGWKTLKSLGRGSATVKLVLVDGKWLIDDAS